ncbi:hypothetical protein ACFL5H_01340 [Candidatus Latescibacterota bacterium]
MDKQKIDQRLKEIEEEVLLLSGYLSDSVEDKLGVHLNGIKEALDQLQKDVSNISVGDKKDLEIKDSVKKLQSDLGDLLTTIGSADYKAKDDNLTRRIEKKSEDIISKVISLDGSFDELSKKIGEKQDEIKKTILENLAKIQSVTEAVRQLCVIEGDKKLGSEIALINTKLENVLKQFPETSETVNKGLLSLNTNVQESIQQTLDQQINIRDTLLKEIDAINENAEIIRRMCTTNEEKYIGSMTTVIYNGVLDLYEDFGTFSENVKKWIQVIDKNIRAGNNQILAKQEEIKKVILYDINKLSEITETLRGWFAIEEDRLLGNEIIMVSNRVEKMSEEIPDIQEKVTALFSQIEKSSSEIVRMRWFVIGAVAISIIVLIASFFN